ncbi:MAG: type II secretion system protein [Phycisphaerales bacterium]|nr:MAG: type II secretion system protein [Phycisphaerales bacterium]
MEKRKGFTLVELLVVIAVVALLMAMLLPVLWRVKRQAKEVLCRSNLREWGVVFGMYTSGNDGYLPRCRGGDGPTEMGWSVKILDYEQRHYTGTEDIRLCPTAAEVGTGVDDEGRRILGSTFEAWGWVEASDKTDLWKEYRGSYGLNRWVWNYDYKWIDAKVADRWWRTPLVQGASNVPVFVDCAWESMWAGEEDDPPEQEEQFESAMSYYCLNRHDGGVNGLFLDWSVRELGLKQLWTLKWHRQFDTAGPWTRAGGCTAEKWPSWMRTFEDY